MKRTTRDTPRSNRRSAARAVGRLDTRSFAWSAGAENPAHGAPGPSPPRPLRRYLPEVSHSHAGQYRNGTAGRAFFRHGARSRLPFRRRGGWGRHPSSG
jgi:hypothetical protein